MIEIIAKMVGYRTTTETRDYAVAHKETIGQAMGKLMEPVGVNLERCLCPGTTLLIRRSKVQVLDGAHGK